MSSQEALASGEDPEFIIRYGKKWRKPKWDAFNIELRCFAHPEQFPQSPGRAYHFKRIVNALWGPHNTAKQFVWHPWADRMNEEAATCDRLAVAGPASSGKSLFFGIWGIINFLAGPHETLVMVTSTTLKEARKRIWGSIQGWWRTMPGIAPGKVIDSMGYIRPDDGTGKNPYSDQCGIWLIPAEKKQEKEAMGKLIGMKNRRVILIIDEMTEISEAVLNAALSNLDANQNLQIIGLGNPASRYDSFGVFSQPKAGWDSITVDDDEWETNYGKAIHFDGTKNPNVLAGEVVYDFMPSAEKLESKRVELGPESLEYWRMYRGFWCPIGSEDAVYSEADIVKHKADQPAIWNDQLPTLVAALDPSFTHGGDRCPVYFGKVGVNLNGVPTISFCDYELLVEDVTNKAEPRSFQISRLFKEACEKRGISPRYAAFDATGGGGPFGDVLSTVWSNDVLRVHFGGSPSDLPVSAYDSTPSSHKYADRVTELWFSGKELMRNDQIRGLSREVITEMTARRYDTIKRGDNVVVRVESKRDMKLRIGKSPDLADAAFILIDLCRQRLKFASQGRIVTPGSQPKTWQNSIRRLSRVASLPSHLSA